MKALDSTASKQVPATPRLTSAELIRDLFGLEPEEVMQQLKQAEANVRETSRLLRERKLFG